MQIQNKAFTLVELIVVITILAVLATVAFISFQGYTSSSRDSVRLADLKNISKAFEINRTKGILFPLPDNKIDISASGTIFQYQGELSEEILNKEFNIFNGGVDPETLKPYGYAVNLARNKFQLVGFLENYDSVANLQKNTLFADNNDKYVKTIGDTLGILLDNNSLDTLIQSGSLDSVNIDTTSQNYSIIIDETIFSGNNELISNKLKFRSQPDSSCLAILLNGNSQGSGIYTVNPTGNREFDVFCDMKTNGGGNAVFTSSFNLDYSDSLECVNHELFSDTQRENISELLAISSGVDIDTDLYTTIQADDSKNNSTIYAVESETGNEYNIVISYGRNHTAIRLSDQKDSFYCYAPDSSNYCGELNKPLRGEYTPQLVFFEFNYQPTCNGSTAHGDKWSRNQFTLQGTYYNISIK